MFKRCSKCGETKARSEFSTDRSKPDGVYAHCKACVRVVQNAWRAEYRAKHGVDPKTTIRRRDPQARLANILRSRLSAALKLKFKTGSAVRDLGMPIDVFLVYINLDALDKYGIPYTGNESKFHIDHIKPLVSFDLQEPEQLRIAVRWDNLQVLTVKENLEKSAKLISD